MASGRFTVDIGPPEYNPNSGPYTFVQKAVKIDADAGFRDLHLTQTEGIVIALDWVAKDRHHLWGSAVMVAPGVALSAIHVIDAMRNNGFLAGQGGELWAISFHADRVEHWRVDSFSKDQEKGDLCLLTLVRSTAPSVPSAGIPLKFGLARMAARVPCVGETISLIGFRATKEFFEHGADMGLSLFGSVGLVTERYPTGRERCLLPNPAIEVNACTKGGMSGGAAFDAKGHLIGVISTGLDEGPSFVSLSWPAIPVPIVPKWPASIMPAETSLGAMATVGRCGIEHLERVHVGTKDGVLMASLSDPDNGQDSNPP